MNFHLRVATHMQLGLPFRIERPHQRITKELRPAIHKIASTCNNTCRTCTKSILTYFQLPTALICQTVTNNRPSQRFRCNDTTATWHGGNSCGIYIVGNSSAFSASPFQSDSRRLGKSLIPRVEQISTLAFLVHTNLSP